MSRTAVSRELARGLIVGLCLLPVPASAFYGDVVMSRTTPRYAFPPAVFPHWAHRVQFRCDVCHPALFRMQAGAHEILMERMVARADFCATCHAGALAWKPVNCGRCHRHAGGPSPVEDPRTATLPVPGPPFAQDNRDPNVALRDFPRDADGYVDWVEALRRELFQPRPSLSSLPRPSERIPEASVMARTGALPPVVFSHAAHAAWLGCVNCHPTPFVAKKGANTILMAEMLSGKSCGLCHNTVAFPVMQCSRCHRASRVHN